MHLRSLRPSLRGPLRPALLPAPRPPVAYYASGWTDADYYQSAADAGRSVIGTVRLVGYLLSLPASSQRIIACNISSGQVGWRIQSGNGTADSISMIAGGGWGWAESPRPVFVAGDVGKLFVLHGWVDGSGLHIAIGGAEFGSPTAVGGAIGDPGAGGAMTLGRYQHAGGFSNPHVGVVSVSATPAALTPAEVAADAAAIMARPQQLSIPLLPGEDMRFIASDAIGGPWPDRIGSDCTLTESGAVTVSLVP